jgi:hypothetical protein
VELHVTGPDFRAVATYTAAIALCRAQNTELFQFRSERYEFRSDVPAIDLLYGGPSVREAMIAGEKPRSLAENVSRTDISKYREILAALSAN